MQGRVNPVEGLGGGVGEKEDRSLSEKSTEDHVWRVDLAYHDAEGQCCLLVATD